MLKKRIAKWSLDRKHKQSDMLFALRLASQREAEGKKTVFNIRERKVTVEEIKHYFRRKGMLDTKSLIASAATAIPTTAIDCRTPEQSPGYSKTHPRHDETPDLGGAIDIEDLPAYRNPAAVEPSTASLLATIPNWSFHADSILQFPSIGNQLEHLLYCGSTYYDSLFETPRWRYMNDSLDMRPLEAFFREHFRGAIFA